MLVLKRKCKSRCGPSKLIVNPQLSFVCFSEWKNDIRNNQTPLPPNLGRCSVNRVSSVIFCDLVYWNCIFWQLYCDWALCEYWGYYLKWDIALSLNLGIRWENRQLQPLSIIKGWVKMRILRRSMQPNSEHWGLGVSGVTSRLILDRWWEACRWRKFICLTLAK